MFLRRHIEMHVFIFCFRKQVPSEGQDFQCVCCGLKVLLSLCLHLEPPSGWPQYFLMHSPYIVFCKCMCLCVTSESIGKIMNSIKWYASFGIADKTPVHQLGNSFKYDIKVYINRNACWHTLCHSPGNASMHMAEWKGSCNLSSKYNVNYKYTWTPWHNMHGLATIRLWLELFLENKKNIKYLNKRTKMSSPYFTLFQLLNILSLCIPFFYPPTRSMILADRCIPFVMCSIPCLAHVATPDRWPHLSTGSQPDHMTAAGGVPDGQTTPPVGLMAYFMFLSIFSSVNSF